MLRGLQPLKLLGNATSTAATEPNRPPGFDYEENDDDYDESEKQEDSPDNDDDDADNKDDDDDDEDVPIFSSPLEHDEEGVPAAATPSDTSTEQPSTPVMAPAVVDPVPLTPKGTPEKSHDKDSALGVTVAKTSASDKGETTKELATHSTQPPANAITPCVKEKGPKNNSNVKNKRAKRPSLAEQTQESSLKMAQKLLQYNETNCKNLQDEWKRAQKVVKRLQQQLQEAQDLQQHYQTQLDEAMKHKKEASKEYRKLTKVWEKYLTMATKKEELRNEELKALKKEALKRRVAVDDESDDDAAPPNKKRKSKGDHSPKEQQKNNKKTKTSKKAKAKEDSDDDESSDDSDTDPRNSSDEDDDSDWEGARRPKPSKKNSPTSTNVEVESEKRASGRRNVSRSKEWSCPTCTLLNPPDLEECDACGTPK